METIINSHLRRLSRALVQHQNEDIYASHRELYLIGEAVIPHVSERLLANSWRKVKFKEQLSLLSGLLGLVHDIDEEAAREIAKRIEREGCDSVVQGIMRSIFSFSLANFERFVAEGVTVHRSKELVEPRTIERKFTEWLAAVPESDRERIDRIYVVPSCGSDARGTYTPILCKIAVEWDVSSNPFLHWFQFLRVERTLYHEIGHHVHGHRLGQDLDQEEEADDYARALVRRNHPYLWSVVKLVKSIAKLSGRSKGQAAES